MNQNNLINIFKQCYLSQNDQERKSSQSKLDNEIYNQSDNFVQNCCQILQSQNNPPNIQILIMTGLRQTIRPNRNPGAKESIWNKISQKSKSDLMQTCFTLIISPNNQIKKTASNLISAFFIMNRLYENDKNYKILQILIDQVENQNNDVQAASIYSLGYICENVYEFPNAKVSDQEFNQLFYGIFLGLKKNIDLQEASLRAIGVSVDYLINNMNVQAVADHVFQEMVEILKQFQQKNDFQNLSKTINVLQDLCEGIHLKLIRYLNIVFAQISDCFINTKNQQVQVAFFSFFAKMFKLEKLNGTDYLDSFQQGIVELVYNFIINHEENVEEIQGGLSLYNQSLELLKQINNKYIDINYDNSIEFVLKNIESNQQSQISALIVLTSLLESAPNDIEQYLKNGFSNFLNLLKSRNPILIFICFQLFNEIASHKNSSLFYPQNNNDLFETIFLIVKSESNDPIEMKFKEEAVKIIHNLSVSYKNTNQNLTSNFSGKVNQIVSFLIEQLNVVSDLSFQDTIVSALFSLVSYVVSSDNFCNYYENFQQLLFSIQKNQNLTIEAKKKLIDYILIIMNSILTNLKLRNLQFYINGNKQDFLFKVYKFCDKYMSQENETSRECYEMMTTILIQYKYNLGQVKEFMNNYLMKSLKDHTRESIFEVSIDSYLRIASYYQMDFDNIAFLLEYLFNLLENPELTDNMCIVIYKGFSDICQEFPQIFSIRLNIFYKIFRKHCQQARGILQQQNHRMIEGLKIKMDTYYDISCNILHNIYHEQQNQQNHHLIRENTFQFLDLLCFYCKSINKPSLELQVDTLNIYCDLYVSIENEEVVNQEFLNQLIQNLKRAKMTESINNVLQYARGTFPSFFGQQPLQFKLNQQNCQKQNFYIGILF